MRKFNKKTAADSRAGDLEKNKLENVNLPPSIFRLLFNTYTVQLATLVSIHQIDPVYERVLHSPYSVIVCLNLDLRTKINHFNNKQRILAKYSKSVEQSRDTIGLLGHE